MHKLVEISPDAWLFVVITALIVFFLGIAIGRRSRLRHQFHRGRPKFDLWKSTLPWLAASLLVALITGILVVLAASLTIKVWEDVHAPLSGTEANNTGSVQRTGQPPPGDANSAVSNALTVMGIIVAVVTLVLTLGATWTAHLQRTLDKKLRALDDTFDRQKRKDQVELQADGLEVKLLAAKQAALHWMLEIGTNREILPLQLQQVYLDLEQLGVGDINVRRQSFLTLAYLFDPWTHGLAPIREYTEECHLRALNRAWYLQKVQSPMEHVALEKSGLACKVFDSEEVKRVLKIA
jgi:hypothetical protein